MQIKALTVKPVIVPVRAGKDHRHRAGLPGNVKAVLNYIREGEKLYMSLASHAREALEVEGVI